MKAQGEAKNAPGSVILGYFCAALIAVMAIMMAIQVIGRYALQNPPDWTEELARVFFVYATFFGAALAVEDLTRQQGASGYRRVRTAASPSRKNFVRYRLAPAGMRHSHHHRISGLFLR